MIYILDEMTVREARRILEETHLIFGDERCIVAHELLLLGAELCEMRRIPPNLPYAIPPHLLCMTAAQIRAEMAARRKIGAQS